MFQTTNQYSSSSFFCFILPFFDIGVPVVASWGSKGKAIQSTGFPLDYSQNEPTE